jgi:uncharacterized integral membrane protein
MVTFSLSAYRVTISLAGSKFDIGSLTLFPLSFILLTILQLFNILGDEINLVFWRKIFPVGVAN